MRENTITDTLKRLEEKLKWDAICPKCGEAWNRLTENGNCWECVDIEAKHKRQEEVISRIVGPYAFENFRFQTFRAPTQTHESLLSLCLKFRPEKDNLCLYGPVGSGKTHLATAIFVEWYEALQGDAGFEKPRALGRHLRGRLPSDEEEIVKNISSKKLLIIDDLGLEKGSEFMFGLLYEIVDYRVQHGINGLVITTNLTMNEISKRFGDDRLSSRLNKMCKVVEFSVPDFRNSSSRDMVYEP